MDVKIQTCYGSRITSLPLFLRVCVRLRVHWRSKKDLMIRVSKLFKLEVARDVSSAKLLDPSMRVIEVTSLTDESYMEGMEAIEKLAAQIVG